jgi:deazaflavin-dependent oxidoreductase (nitroreductase family)
MTLPHELVEAASDATGAELASWGRVLLLETRGRRSGARRVTPVGFVEEPDGSLLIAAGSPGTRWARNLLAEPQCRVAWSSEDRRCVAEPLPDDEAARAVTALILRYGTPAEGLGSGPAFRLRAVPTGTGEPA